MEQHLAEIYGANEGGQALAALKETVAAGAVQISGTVAESAKGSSSGGSRGEEEEEEGGGGGNYNRPCLIAYADSLVAAGQGAHAAKHRDAESGSASTPLQLLADIMHGGNSSPASFPQLAATFPVLHILPFYPWDTDRGFSVKDYRRVDPRNGTWDDVARLAAGNTELMFDFVANHASVDNPLIQNALLQRHVTKEMSAAVFDRVQPFRDFVIAYDDSNRPADDTLAQLARPRPNPVLTRYFVVHDGEDSFRALLGTPAADLLSGSDNENTVVIGSGWCWTTFSRGVDPATGRENTRQVDLNFSNWRVLVEVVRILIEYVARGCRIVRLDAVGYIWKSLGRPSIHEENAHRLIKVMRECMRSVSSKTIMIAEVNEPNSKLLPYLGASGGEPESDMVYQFAAYPVATHAVLRETSRYYANFLRSTAEFGGRQYITVLGSHDGMAMKQAAELLPAEEMEWFGGILGSAPRNCLVNYASLPGGKRVLYECCGTPWSAINGAVSGGDAEERLARARYLAVVAMGQLVRGMPAVYINGLLCSENFTPDGGLDENRTILRERFEPAALRSLLKTPRDGMVEPRYAPVCRLLRATMDARVAPYFASNGPAPEVLGEVSSTPTPDGVLCARLFRAAGRGTDFLMVLVNVTGLKQRVQVPVTDCGSSELEDVLGLLMAQKAVAIAMDYGEDGKGKATCELEPYAVAWLLPKGHEVPH